MTQIVYRLPDVIVWLFNLTGTITVTITKTDGESVVCSGSVNHVRSELEKLESSIATEDIAGIQVERRPSRPA